MPDSSVQPTTAGRIDLLAQAHARSVAVGLRAGDMPDFTPLSQIALRELLDGNRALYAHACPVMETLHAQIAETRGLVLLADSDGMILHSIGDADFIEKAKRAVVDPGVAWAEHLRGTNGIGTALAAGEAIVVHGDEHFLRANYTLTCSGTPIVDPFGRTLGVLDVTGDSRGFNSQTLALVRMSAQLIENLLFSNQCTEALRVRFHAHVECVDSLFAGHVAFDPDGMLIAANRSAQFQLGAPFDVLRGQGCDALFGLQFNALAQQAARAPDTTFTAVLSTGVRVLARCTFPDAQRTAVAVPRTAPVPVTEPRTVRDPDAITFAMLDTGDARMAAVLAGAGKVRGRDLPVLILGQTGTGKEWLARALHHASPRADGPFVAVNCAALPDTLIEAELFGYEDGAFTGARKRGSPGRVAQADGGTLFLDEIGDMPPAQQVRLMRVLQERAVVPLGGARAVPVDVRIVCATHRDLRAMIAEGTFREDLFYRINGLALTLPPLSARTDLPVLVERILDLLNRSEPMPRRVSADVLDAFARCRWPGNLRQLTNVLRTAGMLAEEEAEIELAHLPDDFWLDCDEAPGAAGPQPVADATTLHAHQAALIEATLARFRGNVSATARALGLARNTIYRHLRER